MSDTTAGQPPGADRYAIRVQGHIGPRWAARLEGMTLTQTRDGTTLLTGELVDQAALHGLLNRVRDLGLPLLSVTQVADAARPDAPAAHARTTTTDRTKETMMTPTTHHLLRLAGLSALLAGLCYVAVGLFHPANALSSVTTTRWAVVHVLACAMCFFGLIGMTGLYLRQVRTSGWLALTGFVMLSFWLTVVLGFSFVEAFILPQVATVTPSFVQGWMGMFNGTAGTTDLGVLPTLWTLTGPLYILGGLLFGLATFRARILPRGAAVLLALGTALAPTAAMLPLGAQPKIAIPTGAALAWLGYALLTERRTPAAQDAERAIEVVA